ncbi:MAG: hypothetical protein HRU35_01120 [Rickettsiaceae bacterium]|nr:hypothetical protein [Rickettsiaceae bacterium]
MASKLPGHVSIEKIRRIINKSPGDDFKPSMLSFQEFKLKDPLEKTIFWQGKSQALHYDKQTIRRNSRLITKLKESIFSQENLQNPAKHEFLDSKDALYQDIVVSSVIDYINNSPHGQMFKERIFTANKNGISEKIFKEVENIYQDKQTAFDINKQKLNMRYHNQRVYLKMTQHPNRAKLHETIVRDIFILQQNQIDQKDLIHSHQGKITKSCFDIIAKSAEFTESGYEYNVDREDKRNLAINIYNNINNPKWWQNLTYSQLENNKYFGYILQQDFKVAEKLNKLEIFGNRRDKAKTTEEYLQVLQEEFEFCRTVADKKLLKVRDINSLSRVNHVNKVVRVYNKNNNFINELYRDIKMIKQLNIMKDRDILSLFRQERNILDISKKIFNKCQYHYIDQIRADLTLMKKQHKIQRHNKTFANSRLYMKHCLNNQLIKTYLKNSNFLNYLQSRYRTESIVYQNKFSKGISF